MGNMTTNSLLVNERHSSRRCMGGSTNDNNENDLTAGSNHYKLHAANTRQPQKVVEALAMTTMVCRG